MAPREETVEGRLVDEAGAPLVGLRVEARQARVVGRDARMAEGRTDAEGRFRLAFRRTLLRELTTLPELELVVLDRRGVRELARVAPDAASPLVVPRAEAEGWLVTLGTGAPTRLTHGNAARLLVDAEDGMARLHAALDDATRTVTVLQLLLKQDFRGRGEGRTLLARLDEAAARGAQVRILLNENILATDDADDVAAFARGVPNLEACGLVLQPGVMHAKTVVIDDALAFLVGMPFQQRFWDTRSHALNDPRRGQPMPNHDVMVEVRGPAVHDLGALFAELWNRQAAANRVPTRWPPPPREQPTAGAHTIQVTRTMPEDLHGGAPETGSLEAVRRALAQAQRFLYFENQYLTSAAFVEGLTAALEAEPDLECILVLNERTDVPTYNPWQASRVRALEGLPNLGLFSLWTPGEHDGRRGVAPVYVHSKVAFADDAWAMVGSANLDGIGLDGAREFALPHAYSVELNLTLLDGIAGAPRTGHVAAWRARLWSEHLGMPEDALRAMAPEGWLATWRRVAQENLERVRAGDLALQGHVLPHAPDLMPSLLLDVGP